MAKIARDENHHFLFYRGVTTEMLAQAPDVVLPALNRVLQNFAMPGTKIPGFARRALQMARIGIYNQRIHAENIIDPLLRFWKIEDITDLSPEAEQARDDIFAVGPTLIRAAEKFEARQDRVSKKAASVA
jgi:acyl-[acyl-carrier-protein] desaturase